MFNPHFAPCCWSNPNLGCLNPSSCWIVPSYRSLITGAGDPGLLIQKTPWHSVPWRHIASAGWTCWHPCSSRSLPNLPGVAKSDAFVKGVKRWNSRYISIWSKFKIVVICGLGHSPCVRTSIKNSAIEILYVISMFKMENINTFNII